MVTKTDVSHCLVLYSLAPTHTLSLLFSHCGFLINIIYVVHQSQPCP